MAKPTNASLNRCKQALRKVVPDSVSDEFISKIVDKMGELKEREGLRGTKTAFRKAVGELAQETRMALAKQRVERAQNILKKNGRVSYYQQFNTGTGKRRGMQMAEALMSKLGGGQQLIPGINDSVSARKQVLYLDYSSRIFAGLDENKGLWKMFDEGVLEREIMMEMHEIGRPNGQPGVSKSTEAKQIADVLAAVQRRRWQDLSDAGVDIGKIENRIMPQVWDPKKARDAGLENWKAAIAPLLDAEKTFGLDAGNPAKMDEFLDAAYKSITEGKFEEGDDILKTSDELITTANFAKLGDQINKSRQLFFKDGNAFFEFNQKFGAQSLKQAIHREMRANARNVALIDTFGTNPDASIKADQTRIRRMLKGDEEALAAFDAKMQGVDNLYAQVSGTVNRAADQTLATYSGAVRSLINIQSLGGTVLRSFPDLANAVAITAGATGNGLGHTALNVTKAFMESVPRGNRAAVAELIGLGIKDHFAEIAAITGADAIEKVPGSLAKANMHFFRWIGLEDWTESTRLVTPMLLSREAGMHAEFKFGDLPEQYRANLQRYNIGETEWGYLSKTVHQLEDGSKIFRPDILREVNPSVDGKALRQAEIRWKTYLQEHADFSAPNPGDRVRARINQGTQSGTIAGEAFRFVGQFKAFPLFAYDIGLRILSQNPNKPIQYYRDILKFHGDWQRLIGYMAGATALGYVGDVAMSISKNETPPDPTDPWTWKRAMQLSGTGGLMGDVLLGEAQRLQNQGLLATMAGPAAGKAADVASISAGMIRHGLSGQDTTPDELRAFNFMVRQVPGNNIFYMKSAMDQLFLDRIRNGIDEDFDERRRKRMEENNKSQLIDF